MQDCLQAEAVVLRQFADRRQPVARQIGPSIDLSMESIREKLVRRVHWGAGGG
jgi:hypothetical protein